MESEVIKKRFERDPLFLLPYEDSRKISVYEPVSGPTEHKTLNPLDPHSRTSHLPEL